MGRTVGKEVGERPQALASKPCLEGSARRKCGRCLLGFATPGMTPGAVRANSRSVEAQQEAPFLVAVGGDGGSERIRVSWSPGVTAALPAEKAVGNSCPHRRKLAKTASLRSPGQGLGWSRDGAWLQTKAGTRYRRDIHRMPARFTGSTVGAGFGIPCSRWPASIAGAGLRSPGQVSSIAGAGNGRIARLSGQVFSTVGAGFGVAKCCSERTCVPLYFCYLGKKN